MRMVFRIIFCGVFIAILSSCAIGENKNVDDSNWKETYATLYKYGYGRGAVSMIYYRVEGKLYKTNGSFSVQGKVLGDKYLIKYNPDNPKQIKEYAWNVGFLKTEKTVEAVGIINSISSANLIFGRAKDMQIVFTYTVNDKEYQRSQDLQPDYKEKYPNLSEGQKYKVLYWDKNPQRAVLYLDKPIKENNEH